MTPLLSREKIGLIGIDDFGTRWALSVGGLFSLLRVFDEYLPRWNLYFTKRASTGWRLFGRHGEMEPWNV